MLFLSGCIQIELNEDGYRASGQFDKRFGPDPPVELARTPPDPSVLAYEARVSDLRPPAGKQRYLWVMVNQSGCASYPPTLDDWGAFMDSIRQAAIADFRLLVTSYDRFMIRQYHRWLPDQGWQEPIFVLNNADYGRNRKRKAQRAWEELAGPGVEARPAPVDHLLLDPEGRLVYTAREDENPTTQGAKPRATIEAEIRQLLAQL
jgi:hypothetical protein